MEKKKILMNDIISSIEKAIKENLHIESVVGNRFTSIVIYNPKNECLFIDYDSSNSSYIVISDNYHNSIKIEVPEIDIAKFKVEAFKAEEYSNNKVIEYFNNFFEEEDSRPTTINDLDSEDD